MFGGHGADCWMLATRNANGNQVANPDKYVIDCVCVVRVLWCVRGRGPWVDRCVLCGRQVPERLPGGDRLPALTKPVQWPVHRQGCVCVR